jgi:hypothetical protein
MRFFLPRKPVILGFHRWLGALAALFLLVLAVTGLALNHAERLGLNDFQVRADFILARYGMPVAEDITSIGMGTNDIVSQLNGTLYLNGKELAPGAAIAGIHQGDELWVVASSDALVLLTPEGEFVERIVVGELPFREVRQLAKDTGGDSVIVADNGLWKPGPQWLEFKSFRGEYTIGPVREVNLDEGLAGSILEHNRGRGISLHRVMLDLHSGRLLGVNGGIVMDLTAVSILLLISSGISGWLRRRRWPVRGQP